MNKRLFLKLCLVMVAGVVALFWIIDLVTSRTETGMSFIAPAHRQQITDWGKEAERLYLAGDPQALETWLHELSEREDTWAAVAGFQAQLLAGPPLTQDYSGDYFLGRSVDWQIHLYMKQNPVMEVPFDSIEEQVGFLIRLPARMRPGSNLELTWLSLQIVLPMLLLGLVAFILYRHIMTPLRKLKQATHSFSLGKLDSRVRQSLGNRSDELSELADTFDQMAERIGTLVVSQRQLISDVSHELRTPLTRLDLAAQNLGQGRQTEDNLKRISRESANIRKLVDDSLTLAWLENERPDLQQETLDLTDLIDVLAEDARFEFPDRTLTLALPQTAPISNSSHRALGQALENILRNALRFTPANKTVSLAVTDSGDQYCIRIEDEGGGVPEQDLERIFQPFYRTATSRHECPDGFGLGLTLAQRQIAAVGGTLRASNNRGRGLAMIIELPKRRTSPLPPA